MRVLINDGMDKEGIAVFHDAGIEAETRKRDLASLISDIGEFDALVVRSATQVTREVLEAGARGALEIVGRAGVGYDNIDVGAASENGVIVKFAPQGNTNSAAELALALMFDVSRKISQAHYSLHNGLWVKKPFKGTELSHKILGIIGCGNIGQRLSQLTAGFNMEVIGYDANQEIIKEKFPDSRIKYMQLDDVLRNADYISIHTGGDAVVVGGRELALIKPTAYLINASRASNLDYNALITALEQKRLAGAGLDVHPNEPEKDGAPYTSPLASLDNVVLTSHLGAQTEEGQTRTSVEIARAVTDYFMKVDFTRSANATESVAGEQRPVYRLFLHHQDIVGAFAAIDDVLARNGINIRENSSRQLGKDGYVKTGYLVHQPVSEHVLRELNSLPFVLRARTPLFKQS